MDRARPASPVEAHPPATPDEAEGEAHSPATPPHGDPLGDHVANPPHAPMGKDTPPMSGNRTGDKRETEPNQGDR